MKEPKKHWFRVCAICGKAGGIGSTAILRALNYNIEPGRIGYAHSQCIQKARR